ncbi:hypothetical protein [Mucilaginibacter aquariorum]|uniref:Uncharacterized protein n=1 Tax=Mucilaginibacter aquariorum TaxID=2967225 RepID=A0ABT1T2R3_9SPHI|nr:hypothetical protein [Mucilaginibacter aquariorum]MCQ6958857.1 hypothetical protein [Mucilaginibacter aquariorum]
MTGFLFSSPVGKTASGENGQNDGGLERGKGIGNFAEAGAMSERSGAKDSSPWFCPVCGAKARCGREAFLPT